MRVVLAVCLTAVLVASCSGYPTQLKQATSAGAFIGEGINNIATALLQDSETQDAQKLSNAAFSPLGYSAILAALAEGASGDTRAQLLAALKLPQDSSLTRATYRTVLGRMKEKNVVNKPEFRSWFYVYKKTAQVEDEYTSLLRDSYLMEVRDVESIELDTPTEFFTKKQQQINDNEKVEETSDKDEKDEEKKDPIPEQVTDKATMPDVLEEVTIQNEKKETATKLETKPEEDDKKDATLSANEKQPDVLELKPETEPAKEEAPKSSIPEEVIPVKEEMSLKEQTPMKEEMLTVEALPVKEEIPKKDEMPIKEEMPVKETMPAQEEMPMKEEMPVKEEISIKEVMPVKEEMPTMDDSSKTADTKADAVKVPATEVPPTEVPPSKHDSESIKEKEVSDHTDDVVKTKEPAEEKLGKELMDEPAKEPSEKAATAKFNRGEVKDEKKPTTVSKGGKRKEEIVKDGEKKKGRAAEGSEVTDSRQPASGKSLLTTFNALYYKGMWQTPFDTKIKDNFYSLDGQSKEVTIIRTQGEFLSGEIKELDATAIELPYKGEGGRYSLLVLLPRTKDGLPQLTAALSKFSMRNLSKYMREKQVDVALPEFEIDCVSHPETVFRKLGMTSMLDKNTAEFPGISKGLRLYLQADSMAQLVRFRLDDDSAVANYLSTASMSTRSGLNVFHATHPFLFFLRDNVDGLTVVAGRVTDPSLRPVSLLQD